MCSCVDSKWVLSRKVRDRRKKKRVGKRPATMHFADNKKILPKIHADHTSDHDQMFLSGHFCAHAIQEYLRQPNAVPNFAFDEQAFRSSTGLFALFFVARFFLNPILGRAGPAQILPLKISRRASGNAPSPVTVRSNSAQNTISLSHPKHERADPQIAATL